MRALANAAAAVLLASSAASMLQELNLRGSHLLFRDKRHQLHVFDLAAQTRSSLLNFCQYVQWVPGSDVVVAQSRSNLCVWYSVKNPDRVTMISIKGDVEGIERSPGRTEVMVDEGLTTTSYALDEALIDFGSALDDLVSSSGPSNSSGMRGWLQSRSCRTQPVCTYSTEHQQVMSTAQVRRQLTPVAVVS
eukprot:GHRQ01037900.1.p1 GENE.GHRQ01037900.1~~GHRQ01037900.1.p1  ORF type:complete len:191 (+),score=69.14 GHRQ01037900.1:939-1511(+)